MFHHVSFIRQIILYCSVKLIMHSLCLSYELKILTYGFNKPPIESKQLETNRVHYSFQ